ncbi:ribonuclease T2 family protein [Consotaella salsifontis]|uniref:Ribonuclease T2 n=1 Tax=Consotaella salsifontis TaxID=1365950 RepID=A0A1T4MC08_9HYPH|nr:hypothetical protein [Consotaella salsifontis]SJZ64411.1 ribonuclease T2 [Consotaella salsifontis]
MTTLRNALFALLLAFTAAPAAAEVPMVGRFAAEARCPAFQSLRQETNPGNVLVEPGKSYQLLARNADPASHYYIVVPGAEPERRWVPIGCGRVSDGSQQADADLLRPASAPGSDERPALYVFAVTWGPAFCEGKPSAPECAGGGKGDRFSLHGLWPQASEYCGTAANLRDRPWSRLPEPAMSATTRRSLDQAMPGTRSYLHRHEWARHGSCYGTDADRYFSDSMKLLGALNGSALRPLFVERAGKTLTLRDVRAAADRSFGEGVGWRVSLHCERDGRRRIITEMTIALAGKITPSANFSDLMAAAPPVRSDCNSGIVDPPGLQ